MNNIKHIFFDLDHTLWDFELNSDLAFKNVFNQLAIPIELGTFLNYYKPINHHYWKLYRNEEVTKDQLRYGRLKDTFDKINFKIADDLIDRIAIDYIDELPNNNFLFEGAIEILAYLKPKYHLHIITNGFNEVQYKKIKNAGIESYFNQVITSEDVGVKKPNPQIFKYAIDKAQTQFSNSMMIGDNYEADIMGAVTLGMKAIYFNANNDVVSDTILSVNKLLDIKKYL
ncbi:MAG: YjjG family noncanonical pyrimidine nucleotidase [Lutibacter sp.]